MNNNIHISNKIKKVRDLLELTQGQFAQESGLSQRDISQIEGGEKKFIPTELIQFLNNRSIDLNWLFSTTTSEEDEGYLKAYANNKSAKLKSGDNAQEYAQMNAQVSIVSEPKTPFKPSLPVILSIDTAGNTVIPFVNVRSRAGYLAGYGDPEYIQELPHYSIPGFTSGRYMAFQIDGWSMFKEEIGEGLRKDDWIICQYVEKLDDIRDNRVYTIVSQEEGIVTKRLLNRLKNDDPRIVAMSDNKSGSYEHLIIRPEQIQQVWEFKLHFSRFISDPRDFYDKISDIQGDYIIIKEELKEFKAKFEEIQKRLKE